MGKFWQQSKTTQKNGSSPVQRVTDVANRASVDQTRPTAATTTTAADYSFPCPAPSSAADVVQCKRYGFFSVRSNNQTTLPKAEQQQQRLSVVSVVCVRLGAKRKLRKVGDFRRGSNPMTSCLSSRRGPRSASGSLQLRLVLLGRHKYSSSSPEVVRVQAT